MKMLRVFIFPPVLATLLTGLAQCFEDFLLDYADQNGYNPVQISDDLMLWLP